MADKIRHSVRSFLQIAPAQSNVVQIQETMDFQTTIIRNRIWYRGDSDELSQFYKSFISESNKTRFWSAVPTLGMDIRKIHTGLPALIVDTITSIVMSDMNDIDVGDKYADTWKKIYEDNNMDDLISDALKDTLISGDGAFKISFDPNISKYPIIEFYSGEQVEYVYKYGRTTEVIFRTVYSKHHKRYTLEETYGYGYIIPKLYLDEKEIELSLLEETKDMQPITFDKKFTLAIPLIIYKSAKWKGRGKSIFDAKTDNFDSFDEVWSQWMDAIRKGRTKEYIPSNMLPRNPNTGELLKPNPFDHAYIENEAAMGEGQKHEIKVVQPAIPHESYIQTYSTALDLCLQGIISPSTLGIDVKKLDNAEAQREKEKATLYTRNTIVEALQKTLPYLVRSALCTVEALNNKNIEEQLKVEVDVNFGEYANPSFESQVETVGKAKSQGIMSTEAAVDELYGDSKDDEWKAEEVRRIKSEQGIEEVAEPDMTADSNLNIDPEPKSTMNMLNGAQVSSLMNVIAMVKTKQLTRNEAISIIVSTLGVSRENAESFIEDKI